MRYIAFIFFAFLSFNCFSQNLHGMSWFNAPKEWSINNGTLTMDVTPHTDYWNKTHYGFTVADGPFYFSRVGGEFEASVKTTGDYKTRFDQMGMMFRIDEKHWVKTGIEYVDGNYHYSTVVTNGHSSWSVINLHQAPTSVWIKVIRRLDALEIFYSLDGKNYQQSNIVYFPDHKDAMVGMMAASPDGNGFKAKFEDFKIEHLPDARRLKWLKNN
ncbi:DUF1349 domain-containing protein [Dongshaea marina]|uniref:DUF1349 domain-containing protein n=1 Tax=Dongshaea marina TaxID=2047966 RepID=UPI000D3E38A0|nr:DUF1349 domain-containing protein [Dongshaea marina]